MTITGLYVPLITPFDNSGDVALDCLAELAHRVLDDGATGLVALGTTAEPSTLTAAERRAVLDVVAGVCAERAAPLIVGANSSAELAQLDGLEGIIAALTLVPPFLRPGEEAVHAHFEVLAGTSPVPMLVYHVPYRTGQELSGAALRRLATIPGVAGTKFAPGALTAEAVMLIADPPPGFAVLCGDDVLLSPMFALGAHGAIAASGHIATSAYAAVVSAWSAEQVGPARDLGYRLAALSAALFAEPNPTVVKAVLHAQGRIPTPAVRRPLLPAQPATVDEALRAVEAVTARSG